METSVACQPLVRCAHHCKSQQAASGEFLQQLGIVLHSACMCAAQISCCAGYLHALHVLLPSESTVHPVSIITMLNSYDCRCAMISTAVTVDKLMSCWHLHGFTVCCEGSRLLPKEARIMNGLNASCGLPFLCAVLAVNHKLQHYTCF